MPLLDMNPEPWDAAARSMSTPAAMHLDHAYAHAHHHHAWPAAPSHVDIGPKHYAAAVAAADMSTFRSHIRHSPIGSGDAGRLATASPRPIPSGAWRLPHGDHSNAPPSLQVHIPQASNQDLSRVPSTSTTAHPHDAQSFTHYEPSSAQYQAPGGSTLLPSFASFQERTTRNEDNDLIIAPMSQRLGCNMCTKLKPLVREIAVAVGDVDENVQVLLTKSVSRTSDFPSDSAVRTAHWILERLRYAKEELQDAGRRPQTSYFPTQAAGTPSLGPRNLSPGNHLKRNADLWEREDMPKRPRSGASSDQPYSLPSAITPREDRRPSMDYGSRDAFQRAAYSPVPDSLPGSAHPKQGSPMMSARGPRALPSPSSMAYPPSAAPSLPPPTAQSVGSPATTYQPASLHTVPTNSATSAHMADLQHQVTLKTLALSTLQTEYGSLLQKLQREKVKSQTIEKKTNVADQEVNELTSKNEELTEQVRVLEQQLEESDKKREVERAEAAKEKEQWGRMLDMGSRLQAQMSKDLQKLKDEKSYLVERIEALENQSPAQRSQHPPHSDGSDHRLSHHPTSKSISAVERSDGEGDQASLKGEVALLNARVSALRSALEDAQHRHHDLKDTAGALAQRSGQINTSIARVLREDEAKTNTRAIESGTAGSLNGNLTPVDQRPNWSPKPASMRPPRSSRGSTTSLSNTATSLERGSISAATSGTTTYSPGSADLGFDATTSSEDVIRSLGPIPAPPPKTMFDSTRYREGDAALPDARYRLDQSHGHMEPGAWTPAEQGHYWSSNDRLIQLKPGSHYPPTSAFRASQSVDSSYRAGSSPYSSGSSPSDTADETSSSSSGPARLSLERHNSDPDLPRHSDAKPALMITPHHRGRHDGFSAQFMGYPREASHMLPPPRPA